MGWMDDFGAVAGVLGSSPSSRSSSYTTWNAKLRSAGFSTDYGRSSAINWSALGSGALGSRGLGAAKAPAYVPPVPPERFDVKYPVRGFQAPGAAPPAPPKSSEGDVFGSIGGALGGTGLNLANVVPWFMERVGVLSHEFATTVPGAGAIAAASDVFATGIKTASDVAGPILDKFPTMVRDGQLADRAKLYRAIAGGPAADFGIGQAISNPLSTLAQYGTYLLPGGMTAVQQNQGAAPLTDIFGKPMSVLNFQYDQYRQMLLRTVDPNGRMAIEQRMGILRDGIDIPMSVKVAIERNPTLSDDDLEKLLSEAPEGRQWSYQEGIPGVVQNMATPLLFYLSEARFLGLAGRGVANVGVPLRGLGGARGVAGAGLQGTGKAVTAAAALQKYAMAAGLGTTALTTTFDAIARYAGNEEAIAWFDRVNRTTKFSDDPNVQLVTSFSVNPFAAGKLAIKGGKAAVRGATKPARVTLDLARGVRVLDISSEVGGRMRSFAGSDGRMIDMIRRMYNLHSDAEAQTFLSTYYEHKGQAFDEVLGVALDEVMDRLPKAQRAVINASFRDPIARTAHVAETYIDDAMTLLEKDAQAVAKRWQERSWGHHNYPGRFSPEVAAENARDYRHAVARTYEARAEMDAVVGYRDFLPPQGQVLARQWLEGHVVEGQVPVEGMDGVQGLIEQFPAMQKHWTGLITNETRIPRATVERMIERAQADWQRVSRQNPVKAATGADPILRPNSPTLTRDTAEALGTNIETLNAIDAGAPNADQLDAVRRFLAQKLEQTPEQTALLSPEEAITRAQRYVEETTRPWRDAGASVASAEREMATLRTEIARLRALPKGVVQADEIIRAERQYAAYSTLVRASSDPVIPFVTEVAHARPEGRRIGRDIALTELATRRAEATTRLRELQTIHEAGAALAGDDWVNLFRQGPGGVQYSGGLPVMSASMRRALRYSDHMGDFEAWSTLGNNLDRVEHLLTKAQRRRAHAVLDSGGWKHQSPAQTIRRAETSTGLAEGDAVEEIARLWGERNGILSGTSEYALRRTANMGLPAQYAALADEMAASGSVERGVVHDPLFAKRTHPTNVARLQDALATPDTFPAARAIIESDPVLSDRYASFMEREGMVARGEVESVAHMDLDGQRIGFTYDALGDSTYYSWLARELIPADFVRPTPGVFVPDGLWDEAILANDKGALEELAQRISGGEAPTFATKPVSTPARVAKRAASRVPLNRPSVRYARRLAEADMTASPDPAVMDALGNRIGLDVLSVMNHGVSGTRPATIGRVVELLRSIENGEARRAGIGDDLAAEAQRVADELLDSAVKQAPRPDTFGVFSKGIFPEDEMKIAGEIEHLLTFDEANPLGTLQYGLKKRPKDAVVLEFSRVPGLAEELMTSRFAPDAERFAIPQVRQAFNYVFGPRSNAVIRAESKVRFLERAAVQGVDADTAGAIHDAWRQIAKESRADVLRKLPGGVRKYMAGDNPLYADVHNIPNSKLDAVAHKTIDELYSAGKIAGEDRYIDGVLHQVDYAALFRESSSAIRRTLADNAGSLGKGLATAYGMAAHNRAVTTAYYWFRFGLDVRYHAMNYLEAQILYYGRAGLRKGEIDQGQLGMTEQFLRNLDSDPMSNTGYQFSQDRMAWAYRTFLKEQPDALRATLKGLDAESPGFTARWLDELAAKDPQIVDMRRQFGDTPEKFLKELDAWHAKMLDSVSIDESGTLIDEAIAEAVRDSPDLAQVYARLGQANKELWDNIRGTFYGNPNRSRAERFLNSYLLFWPLSYQIKSTKWFLGVLFDRMGGIPTNASGAVMFDRLATSHQQLLATDPGYADWFEKHPTLTFTAQMLFPVSFEGTGVSLNPGLRSLFFGRAKSVFDIGPLYTFNHVVPQASKELYADLYPTLKDVPGFDGLYRALTGRQQPAAPKPGPRTDLDTVTLSQS